MPMPEELRGWGAARYFEVSLNQFWDFFWSSGINVGPPFLPNLGLREVQDGCKNEGRSEKIASWRSKWSDASSRREKPRTPHPSGTIFGSSWGPQNYSKSRFLTKMETPRQSFSRFLPGGLRKPTFPSIFHRFLIKKTMYFRRFFSLLPCIFSDLATLTKHRK